jgi:hypothetical protein
MEERKRAQVEQLHLQVQHPRLVAETQQPARLEHQRQAFQMVAAKMQTLWQPETLAVPDE